MRLALVIAAGGSITAFVAATLVEPLALRSMVLLAAGLSGFGAMVRASKRGVRGWPVLIEGVGYWLLAVSLSLIAAIAVVDYVHPGTTYAIAGGIGLLPWIGPELWDRVGEAVLARLGDLAGRILGRGDGNDDDGQPS